MDTTVQDPLVGRVLDGRYQVGPRLARGGMATVYRATDLRLDRPVALKVMHPGLAEDDEFVARFIREARAAARLSHPNVVSVFDQGTDGGVVFLAMEYVEGRTLRDLMRERGALSPRQAFDVLEPVLAALGAAHRAGIMHRDVKPENVLLADDGRVKVADFGLARAVSTSTSATSTAGVLIGTVAYLSPEQVERGASDPRSDVYATGIVLFEMLTGRKPYDGDSPIQIAYRHVHDDVPAPSSVRPGLPAEVDAIVLAAAARDPERRPPDANRMLADVVRARESLSDAELDGSDLSDGGGGVRPVVIDTPERADGLTRQLRRPADSTLVVPLAGAAVDPRATARHDEVGHGPTGHDDTRVIPAGPPPGEGAGAQARRPRRRRRGLIALLVVLLVAAGLSGAAWYVGAGPGAYTTTPSVLEKTAAQARATLEKAGLKTATGDAQFSETVPKGQVLSTDPGPNARIRKGGTVTLILSKGPERFDAPDLAGKTRDQATALLRQANLVPGSVKTAYSDTVPNGQVISQDPDPGTPLKRGSSVAFVVSRGLPPVDVPDVTGKSIQDAQAALSAVGLKADVADSQFSDSVPKDAVIRQDPSSGQLHKGDSVALVVSKGPDLVDVPNVIGKKLEDARRILEDAGVKVNVVKAPFGLGRVYDQSDSGKVKRGSTITLYVV